MSFDRKVKDIFVTCVLCLSNNTENADLMSILSDASTLLKSNYAHYEILVVGDKDSEKYDDMMTRCLKEIEHIRYMRAFGAKTYDELTAIGFDNAIGDITCVFPFGFKLEVDLLALVSKCCYGNDVVMSFSKKCGFFTRFSIVFAQMIGTLVGYDRIPAGFNGVCCASRRAINAAIKDLVFCKYPFLALVKADDLCAYIEQIEAAASPVASNYNVKYALNMVSNLTTKHSQCLCMSFACITFVSSVSLAFARNVSGALASFLLSGIFYLAKNAFISLEKSMNCTRTPEFGSYSIEFEKHSSVMLNTRELNIRDDSISNTINNVQTGRDR